MRGRLSQVSFRELPPTAAGRRRHQTRLSSSRDGPARVSLLSPARPELTGARAVPSVPHRHAPTDPPAGAHLPGPRAPLTLGLCLRGGARGGRPDRVASPLKPGAGSAPGLPHLDTDPLAVETRAPRRPSSARGVSAPRHRPRPPRASRPGRGKDHVRPSPGPAGACSPRTASALSVRHPRPGSGRAASPGPRRARTPGPGLLASAFCRPRTTAGSRRAPGRGREIPPAAVDVTDASPGLPHRGSAPSARPPGPLPDPALSCARSRLGPAPPVWPGSPLGARVAQGLGEGR